MGGGRWLRGRPEATLQSQNRVASDQLRATPDSTELLHAPELFRTRIKGWRRKRARKRPELRLVLRDQDLEDFGSTAVSMK